MPLIYTYGTCPPCYHCERRYITCHSDCEKYKDWSNQHKETLKKRYQSQGDRAFEQLRLEGWEKGKKRNNKSRKSGRFAKFRKK